MSLGNDSLKFTSSDTQICWNFCWKNVSSFCSTKATHIFSAKNIRILYIESAKTVNEMTLNKLIKLTTLWTTGPRTFYGNSLSYLSWIKSNLLTAWWIDKFWRNLKIEYHLSWHYKASPGFRLHFCLWTHKTIRRGCLLFCCEYHKYFHRV